jgi:prophage DNA circulation protein
MSWRDNLQSATFRGVPFKVETATTGVGRRTEMHVYPLYRSGRGTKSQDHVWAQDLGAEPDSFSLTGYVIQTIDNEFDYFEERDRLMRAFKTQGPGKLVHPFFKDVLEVSVDGKVDFAESITGEGGIARFTVNFVQFHIPIFGQLDKDYIQVIDDAVTDLEESSIDFLAETMSTIVFVGSLLQSVRGSLDKIQSVVNGTLGLIASVTSEVTGTLAAISTTADTLLSSPQDLSLALRSASNKILDLVGITGDVIEGGIAGPVSGRIRGNRYVLDGNEIPDWLGINLSKNLAIQSNFDYAELGNVPAAQVDNQKVVALTVQSMLLGVASRVCIRTVFSSYTEMEALVMALTEAFDALLDRIGALQGIVETALLYQAVSNARALFVESMFIKNTGVAKEIIFDVPPGIISTLELAYAQYNDIEREEEIFERNRETIKHPGFLPNGEVVTLLDE